MLTFTLPKYCPNLSENQFSFLLLTLLTLHRQLDLNLTGGVSLSVSDTQSGMKSQGLFVGTN